MSSKEIREKCCYKDLNSDDTVEKGKLAMNSPFAVVDGSST